MTKEKTGPATMVFAGTPCSASPGLEGLFPDSLDTIERRMLCSADKPGLIEEAVALIGFDDDAHILLGQKAALMLDEMLENALYAAPRDIGGCQMFPERAPRALLLNEQIILRYRFDGTRFWVEARDSWGTLTQSQVFLFLSLNTRELEPEPDRTGRGLFFMWWMFDQFYVRIFPGQETVVGGSLLLQTQD